MPDGRCEDVETSPSPFSYAIYPPREVDGLSHIWPPRFSEVTLVEFLQGLQMTSIFNPRFAPVELSCNANGFVDHHFSNFPPVAIIEDSVVQFLE